MKTLANAFHAAVLAAVVAAPALAGDDTSDAVDLDAAFAGSAPVMETLDTSAMEETRGRLPLLAVPLAIAGVDIGLAALYWGVYVPHYSGGGTCTGCSNAIQVH